jgi:transglutaminase-like putative cysteine protease
MSAPPLLLAAAPLFWGWQTGHLVAGTVIGAALAGLALARLRLDLGPAEHASIADLSTIGFVLLAALLAANRGVARGIQEAFIWLPAALVPVLAAQLLSRERRLPLSALFRTLRRLRRADPSVPDPLIDVSAVYLALTLLCAGLANQRGPGYYLGIVVLSAALLYATRPREASLAAGAAMLAAAALLGHAGQLGLGAAQAALEDWILEFGLRAVDTDPFRSRTQIGSLGRLKRDDAIVMRVFAGPEQAGRVRLLHRASYRTLLGTTWVASGAPMVEVVSEPDNETWVLEPAAPQWRVPVATRLESGRALLALPAGTVRIAALPANHMQRNAFGAVHVRVPVDWVRYEALGSDSIAGYAPPAEDDLAVPAAERALFARLAAELGLVELAAEAALRRVADYFGAFSYSTFRERPVPPGETALGDFLTRTRSGHCEYFAAATTLLLRAAGIPARYATGFSAQEYSRLEGAFVVRVRHAHAWTRAWNGARWVDLDTTPAVWLAEEESDAPWWQGLADLARWAAFRWALREEFKAGDGWYAALAVLALVLLWRVLRGRRRVREERAQPPAPRRRWPGEDSEFYAVARMLPARAPGEPLARWLARVSPALPEEQRAMLAEALALHSRYRFDPAGLGASERARLRSACLDLLRAASSRTT